MKFSLVCLSFLAIFAMFRADTVAVPNFDAQFKALAENLEVAAKKFEELSGYKTDFDKEKFLKFLKTNTDQLNEQFKVLNEKLLKESKLVPEELKKKYEDAMKQVQETIKGLNSPEVNAKAAKLQETFQLSAKKVAESANDLAKSFGIAIPPGIQTALNDIMAELNKTAKTVQEKSNKILESIQEELKKKN